MKVFVTGVGGQLGHDVINELTSRGYEAIGSDVVDMVASGVPYVALDITDAQAVEHVITEIRPDAVVHCAAWTAVDAAEDADKQEKVKAIKCGWNTKHCQCGKNGGCKNGIYQHGLCI